MISHIDKLAAALLAGVVLKMMLPPVTTIFFWCTVLFVPLAIALGRPFRWSPRLLFFVIPAAFYCGEAMSTGMEFVLVKSDMRKMALAFAMVSALSLPKMSAEQAKHLELWLFRLVFLAGLVGAALGLVKFSLQIYGIRLAFFEDALTGAYPGGAALQGDYNVYALAILFGLVAAAWLWRREQFRPILILSHATVPLMLAAIALSGSRRGLIFLGCLTGLLLATYARWRLRSKDARTRRLRPTRVAWAWILPGYIAILMVVAVQWNKVTRYAADLVSSKEYEAISERTETILTDELYGSREAYWALGKEEFLRASWPERLFGSGFAYVAEFGRLSGVGEDYPHNLFLSALLYGGVLQAGLLLLLLVVAFRRLAIKPGNARVMAVMLALEVAFLSFSSNSFFSSENASILAQLALAMPALTPQKAAQPQTRLGGSSQLVPSSS